jgi:hypothetical protein
METPVDLAKLKKHLARNISRDDADPLRTSIIPVSRESEIEQWIVLAKESGDEEDHALALASLIAEQSKNSPKRAVTTWEANRKQIEIFPRAAMVANFGLGRAYDNLDQPLRGYSHWGAGSRLYGDLNVQDSDELAGFATISEDGRRIDISDKPPRKFAVELGPNRAINHWLRDRDDIDTTKVGERFGAFVTNDLSFVSAANERLRSLVWQLREPLGKPANYLLEAAPGSGKSFFVREFAKQLQAALNRPSVYLEKNLSAYPSIDAAFADIVLDVILALASHRDVVLFVDEVDTEIAGHRMFQKLIAPMNGDKFFFREKEVEFARQNIVGFYALSGHRDALEQAPKWPDFLSRIPAEHRFVLPTFDNPFERLFRAIGILYRGNMRVTKATVHALLYLSLHEWTSSRELDQALESAKTRMRDPGRVLDLEHVARSVDDVRMTANASKVDISLEVNRPIEIRA